MAESRLGERARSRLIHLVSDDHPEPGPWLRGFRSLRDLEGVPVFSDVVRILFHLEIDDAEGERLLTDVLAHRSALSGRLGRDPGLRVAAMDYLSNVERLLSNPRIVEMEVYEATERSARTDPLTRLANRRVFDEVLEREIRRSRRYRWPLTLLMLDLDRFKDVNDACGHLLGDLVLERVGGLLRESLREADLACRFGGEEFAVVLPETSRLGGYAVAERIRLGVEAAFQQATVGGREIPMTVSCGLSCYPDDGLHPSELVARADEALYGAKRAGRNRVGVRYREKRAAVRFPMKPGASVSLGAEATRGVNLSRTGVLVATETPPRLSEAVAVRLNATVPIRAEGTWEGPGRVVRVVRPTDEDGGYLVGVAFDAPLPEDRLAPNVSLAREAGRSARGTVR